jgi:aldehyde:ferredoxin oxidoreductase
MACAKAVDGFMLRTGPYAGQRVVADGPEYETAAAGANMGCFDPDFIVEWNFYCDTYGIDTISFGTTMAFVMEAFEAGIITKEHTGGKELRFGATDEVLQCIHEMAEGEGFGVEVGQGIRRLTSSLQECVVPVPSQCQIFTRSLLILKWLRMQSIINLCLSKN